MSICCATAGARAMRARRSAARARWRACARAAASSRSQSRLLTYGLDWASAPSRKERPTKGLPRLSGLVRAQLSISPVGSPARGGKAGTTGLQSEFYPEPRSESGRRLRPYGPGERRSVLIYHAVEPGQSIYGQPVWLLVVCREVLECLDASTFCSPGAGWLSGSFAGRFFASAVGDRFANCGV